MLRVQTARFLESARHLPRYVALIERFRATGRHRFQRLGEVLLRQYFARLNRAAVPREYLPRIWESRQLLIERLEPAPQLLADRESVLRVAYRRLYQLAQRPRSEPLVYLLPAKYLARNRGGQRPLQRHILMSALDEELPAGRHRSLAAAVHTMNLPRLGVVHDHERLSAHSARGRNGNRLNRGGRYRRVECVASVSQDFRARRRRQRRYGHHHAAAAVHSVSSRLDSWPRRCNHGSTYPVFGILEQSYHYSGEL